MPGFPKVKARGQNYIGPTWLRILLIKLLVGTTWQLPKVVAKAWKFIKTYKKEWNNSNKLGLQKVRYSVSLNDLKYWNLLQKRILMWNNITFILSYFKF